MTARWRILRRTLIATPRLAKAVILAVVCLHNLLVLNEENVPDEDRVYNAPGFADRMNGDQVVPGGWRQELAAGDVPQPLDVIREAGTGTREKAEAVRENFVDYFLGPGTVPWQWRVLRRL